MWLSVCSLLVKNKKILNGEKKEDENTESIQLNPNYFETEDNLPTVK